MTNRRTHQRIACSASAILRNSSTAEMVKVVELSGGGARVAWNGGTLSAGASLTLLFQSAPFRFHNCPGTVLRQDDGLIVLQFEYNLEEEIVGKLVA